MSETTRIEVKKDPVQRAESGNPACRSRSHEPPGSPSSRIMRFQQTSGNSAVQRMLKSDAIQASLRIGQPNDIYEQEADRVAHDIMRMPKHGVQRQCSPGSECPLKEKEEKPIQTKPAGSFSKIESLPDSFVSGLGSGQLLDPASRAYFEPRFGADFKDVHVLTGSGAEESAQEIGARAYTFGRNIVFGKNQFAPGSADGRQLLAHELTHVIQQSSGNSGTWGLSNTGHFSNKDDTTTTIPVKENLTPSGPGPFSCYGSPAATIQRLSGSTGLSHHHAGTSPCGVGPCQEGGNYRIDVRANALSGIGGILFSHLYIVYTDAAGDEYYFRGGPAHGGVGGGFLGWGADFGNIVVDCGRYLPGTIDYLQNADSITVLTGIGACQAIPTLFGQVGIINGLNVPYHPSGPNCISVVSHMLYQIGQPFTSPVWVNPGSDTPLNAIHHGGDMV
ncbi:MAG: DUF4157 domain-containing protein [Methanoregula sp.]